MCPCRMCLHPCANNGLDPRAYDTFVSKCKDVATPISWYRDEDTCDKGTSTRPPVSPPRPPGTVVRGKPPPVAQSPSGASLRSSSSGRGKAQPSQAPLSQEQ